MTKMIYKHDCKYVKGRIVKQNEVVNLPADVVLQLRKLEGMYQRAEYLKTQAPYSPAPSLDGFEQRHERGNGCPIDIKVEAPTLDAKVEESLKIVGELDELKAAGDLGKLATEFAALYDFADEEWFFEGDIQMTLDIPAIGDPLELTAERITEILKLIVDAAVEDHEATDSMLRHAKLDKLAWKYRYDKGTADCDGDIR